MTKTILSAALLAILAVPSLAQLSEEQYQTNFSLAANAQTLNPGGTGDDAFSLYGSNSLGIPVSFTQIQDQATVNSTAATLGLSASTSTMGYANETAAEGGYGSALAYTTLQFAVQAGNYTFSESWFGHASGANLVFGQSAVADSALVFLPAGNNSATVLAYGPNWNQTSGLTTFVASGQVSWSGYLGAGSVFLYAGIDTSISQTTSSDSGYGQVNETFAAAPAPELPTFLPLLALTGLGLYVKSRRA